MRLLEINDEISNGNKYDYENREMFVRRAARAVIADSEGKLAMMYLAGKDLYKIPGGGIERDESIIESLRRECLEEAGVNIINIEPLAICNEYRYRPDEPLGLVQISYIYKTQFSGNKGEPHYTEKEREDGAELIWIGPDELIEKMERLNPEKYNSQFVWHRELECVRLYIDTMQNP